MFTSCRPDIPGFNP